MSKEFSDFIESNDDQIDITGKVLAGIILGGMLLLALIVASKSLTAMKMFDWVVGFTFPLMMTIPLLFRIKKRKHVLKRWHAISDQPEKLKHEAAVWLDSTERTTERMMLFSWPLFAAIILGVGYWIGRVSHFIPWVITIVPMFICYRFTEQVDAAADQIQKHS